MDDVQRIQAFMLHLEVGLWRGNDCNVELAESLLQRLVTVSLLLLVTCCFRALIFVELFRRSGRFRQSTYSPISLSADDQGQPLEQKWYDWVLQQSLLR